MRKENQGIHQIKVSIIYILRPDISNDYIIGENICPVKRQSTLYYLNNHSNSIVTVPTAP